MAEGAHIDHGGHTNDLSYMLNELLAFDDGIKVALEWANGRGERYYFPITFINGAC